MLELFVFIIVAALLIVGLVKLIDKFLPSKARLAISILLWAVAGFLVYLIHSSIMKPIEFEKAKQERYEFAVQKLLDIKKAQSGFKRVHGRYADNFEEIIKFVENDKFAIISRKDTSVIDVEKNKAFRITTDATGEGGFFKDVVLIDTIGHIAVKDSLFKNTDAYKTLNKVKINDLVIPVVMKSDFLDRNDIRVPVFEATIDKQALLTGLDKELIAQEEKVEAIDEINGDIVKLGSLEEVSITGNWPKKYGKND